MVDTVTLENGCLSQSPSQLFNLFTSHQGLLSFFGQDNKVELKVGGAYEIYFLMDNDTGLKGSEGCKILSFVPNSQLTFSWNAPPKYPDIRNADHYTWVVVDFEQVDKETSKVTLTHAGWPDDGSWQEVYVYFDNAWSYVLTGLDEAVNRNNK